MTVSAVPSAPLRERLAVVLVTHLPTDILNQLTPTLLDALVNAADTATADRDAVARRFVDLETTGTVHDPFWPTTGVSVADGTVTA